MTLCHQHPSVPCFDTPAPRNWRETVDHMGCPKFTSTQAVCKVHDFLIGKSISLCAGKEASQGRERSPPPPGSSQRHSGGALGRPAESDQNPRQEAPHLPGSGRNLSPPGTQETPGSGPWSTEKAGFSRFAPSGQSRYLQPCLGRDPDPMGFPGNSSSDPQLEGSSGEQGRVRWLPPPTKTGPRCLPHPLAHSCSLGK